MNHEVSVTLCLLSMEDWDKVTVIRKRPETAKVARSSSAINAARRAGAVVETGKKCKLVTLITHKQILILSSHWWL